MAGQDPWTILGIPQSTWMSGTFTPTPAQWDALFIAKMDWLAQFQGPIAGVVDGSSAAAGNVGEYISAVVTTGAAVSIPTSGTTINISSISLAAGDWDINGQVGLVASVGASQFQGGISPTPATILALADNASNASLVFASPALVTGAQLGLTRARITVNIVTTMYLVAVATFASGTASAYGKISARRMR